MGKQHIVRLGYRYLSRHDSGDDVGYEMHEEHATNLNQGGDMSVKRICFGVTVRMWLKVIGIALILALPVPWILGNVVIMAAGSGEAVSVRSTGMITCPGLLTWSEWLPGDGSVAYRDDLEPAITIDKQAEIVEYRIGVARKQFAQLTFYQAKYRLPDGTLHMGPARGSKSLISIDTPLAVKYSLFAGAASIFCFWLGAKEPEPLGD